MSLLRVYLIYLFWPDEGYFPLGEHFFTAFECYHFDIMSLLHDKGNLIVLKCFSSCEIRWLLALSWDQKFEILMLWGNSDGKQRFGRIILQSQFSSGLLPLKVEVYCQTNIRQREQHIVYLKTTVEICLGYSTPILIFNIIIRRFNLLVSVKID